jgi:AcrR family transcriptional regulator
VRAQSIYTNVLYICIGRACRILRMSEPARSGHRERLLEAAIACLQERGYAHTTARDLVAASDTNLASIGYHFGSKEHLLNVALTEAFRRWLVPVVALAVAPGPATPLERLERSLTGALASLEENRGLVVACVEAWAQAPRSEDLRGELNAAYEDFRRAIAAVTREAFAEAGAADGIDADALAVLVIAIFDGLLVRSQLDPERVPSGERLLAAAGAAIAALTAPAA